MKIIFKMMFVLTLSLPIAAHASMTLEAQCNDTKGDLTKCTVEGGGSTLKITYGSQKLSSLNKTIDAASIIRISEGEFSKQRTAEALLLSPMFLMSKKKFVSYSIEFAANSSRDFVTLSVRDKMAQTLRSLLQTVSGKEVSKVSIDAGGIAK